MSAFAAAARKGAPPAAPALPIASSAERAGSAQLPAPAYFRVATLAPGGSVAEALETPGRPLDERTRHFAEPRFGRDFGGVTVHDDAVAARSAAALNARAYTLGQHLVFGAGQHAPATGDGRKLIMHELAHVVQQGAGRRAIQRQGQPTPTRRVQVEVVGADATVDEPLAVMADRSARTSGSRVLRVTSIEDMMRRLEPLVGPGACLGRLNVWYHGAPEIQLVVGEYPLGRERRRLPASGFSLEWLALESNRPALTRFRRLFCCDGLMHWYGCGTATVRAGGGLRPPEELSRRRLELAAQPDSYESAEDARRHGASLLGGSFGRVNVQSWANATCVTIRSATGTVHLAPESPTPITISGGGRWMDLHPQGICTCDTASGRLSGEAPTRDETVADMGRQRDEVVGGENAAWHTLLLALRSGIPRRAIVTSGTGERSFRPAAGTLGARLRDEIEGRVAGRRGPIESYFSQTLVQLLRIAGAGIRPPAPLPNTPIPEHLFVRVASGGAWAAVTQPHLVVVNRNDFWHWIVFNDSAIGETPEFTRTVIEHELDHAADYETDFRVFEATNPRPAGDPSREQRFPAEQSTVRGWRDEWGRYINAFVAFHEGRLRPERHLEIILAQQRRSGRGGAPSYDRWSAQERDYWFELVFTHLPPDVPRGTPLGGEQQVLDAFAAADPALQLAVVERATETLRSALRPDLAASTADVAAARASARTLVQHFDPIVARVLRQHFLGTPRDSMLRQLQQAPGVR